MGLSICIPTYNRLPHLKFLLESIFNGFDNYPYEIIVADGGSTDGTVEYLKKFKDITLIEQKELTGAVKAFNLCFKIAKYPYIFWPADDFILVPQVLIRACNFMDKHKEIGIVAPKDQETAFGNLPGVEMLNLLVLSKTHVFRASALKEINYFDENFKTYRIDDDSCLGILNSGYTIIFTKEAGVIHNRIQDETRKHNLNIEKKDYLKEGEYFKNKWAGLNSKINNQVSFVKKCKFKILSLLARGIYKWKLNKILTEKMQPFVLSLYDKLLELCVVFPASEYNFLNDFYLAQKLPKKFLDNKNKKNL